MRPFAASGSLKEGVGVGGREISYSNGHRSCLDVLIRPRTLSAGARPACARDGHSFTTNNSRRNYRDGPVGDSRSRLTRCASTRSCARPRRAGAVLVGIPARALTEAIFTIVVVAEGV